MSGRFVYVGDGVYLVETDDTPRVHLKVEHRHAGAEVLPLVSRSEELRRAGRITFDEYEVRLKEEIAERIKRERIEALRQEFNHDLM